MAASRERRMERNSTWTFLFAAAVAWLMFVVVVLGHEPAPLWAQFTYPIVGAILATVASLTSRSVGGTAKLETATISAAIVLAAAEAAGIALQVAGIDIGLSGSAGKPGFFEDFAVLATLGTGWWVLHGRLLIMRRRHEGTEDRLA